MDGWFYFMFSKRVNGTYVEYTVRQMNLVAATLGSRMNLLFPRKHWAWQKKKREYNYQFNSPTPVTPQLSRYDPLCTREYAHYLITGRICTEQTSQKYSYPHSENPKDDMPLNLEGKSNSLNNCSWKTDYLAYLYPAFPFRFYSTAWRMSPRRLTRSRNYT